MPFPRKKTSNTTPPIGQRRKIVRRKPGSKPSTQYFNKDTEIAIKQYQDEVDIAKKQKIYVQTILPAFDALVENLINVYSFKIMYETKKDLKAECMEFLFTTVNKFDFSKGSKAFSYFNVVAKHWLTIKSKQNAKKTKTYVSSDDREALSNGDLDQIETHQVVKSIEEIIIEKESTQNYKKTKKIIAGLENKIKTENEKLTIKAILEIVDNIDNIELLSKRAVLLYVRELTGINSKQLSCCISSLKKHYKEVKKELVDE